MNMTTYETVSIIIQAVAAIACVWIVLSDIRKKKDQ